MTYLKGAISLLIFSIFASGCAKHQVPITKRNQLMLLSKADEVKIGHKNFAGMIKKLKISHDKEKIDMINRVGQRLINNMGSKRIDFEFILVENDSVNACALPNGKVIVNTGVFLVAKTDDQLATILSHEIAHVVSRHGNARISRNKILNIVEGAGTLIAGILNPFMIVPFIMVYESSAKNTLINSSMRIEENEADIIGLHLMKKANYNLNEALIFWQKLKKNNVNKNHIKSSTHATYDVRIKNIQDTIRKINKKVG